MTHPIRFLITASIVASFALAQQPNSPNASLAINADPSAVVGLGPLDVEAVAGESLTLSVQADPSSPITLFGGQLAVGAMPLTIINSVFDIQPISGSLANNIILGGVDASFPLTDSMGRYDLVAPLPATTVGFEIAAQALVHDSTNPPFALRMTAAAATIAVNQVIFPITGSDVSVVYDFPFAMPFPFYGTAYSQCFVSDNGFVSFGNADNSFPNPMVSTASNGVPRIMSFYTDLVPQISAVYGGMIYAIEFFEAGTQKVRIVHERLAEFGNATGPHGGEAVLAENGDIDVLVALYNAAPSINTVVGITPGMGLDPGPHPTTSGRDLTLDVLSGPTFLASFGIGFEFFDQGSSPPSNPIDLIGFAAEDGGVRFLKTPGLPSYTIQ